MAEMEDQTRIFVARSSKPEYLELAFGNRHGLITGATGTGKTVTLQVLAEGFSARGVPVFLADVKGDLAGLSQPGGGQDFVVKRAAEIGIPYRPDQFPVQFWDVYGELGAPVRATISDVGPLLLSRMLQLNDVQEGVLNVAFKLADDQGLLLLDLKDLRALLADMADKAGDLMKTYGNVSRATVGAIQRQLLVLEQQGGDKFFGEPALDLADIGWVDREGRGTINILAAERLMMAPRLYATFLLWLMSDLFERLPEVGDVDRPRLVFFFDEAHLLFDDAPPALLQKIEQVVRLIRSKGIGIYFVTQNPLDVPDTVLGQLGNRVQHALRAYTPRDQKAVKAAAETFRPNPAVDTARVIAELGKGEALVSFLEGNGVPAMVQRALVLPPSARVGTITPAERQAVMQASRLRGKYERMIDRDSAFEMLQRRVAQEAPPAEGGKTGGGLLDTIFGGGSGGRMTTTQAVIRSVSRTIATTAGREITRAIMRGILGGRAR